jgi:hypothetical protein
VIDLGIKPPPNFDNPSWETRSETYDWRNYVPPQLRAAWLQMSDEARAAAAIVAQEVALREEWD